MSDEVTERTPCRTHARKGYLVGGGTLDGKARHDCPYCLRVHIEELTAGQEALLKMVSALADAVAVNQAAIEVLQRKTNLL